MNIEEKEKLFDYVTKTVLCFEHQTQKTKDELIQYIQENWDRVFVTKSVLDELVLTIK
jgi:hypothetical protein